MSSLRTAATLISLALACSAALAGCAPTLQTAARVPPNFPQAAQLRRIAVVGFKGRNASAVDPAFESMLVSHQFDGASYFTVVDRARTQALMQEYGRSLRGEIDPSTAARFGRQLGTQGVYFGDITRFDLTNRPYTVRESTCSSPKCKKTTWRTVSCRERTATVTLVPRLVDVETGQVVYRAEHTGAASASACSGDSLPADESLTQRALQDALLQIRTDIAPNTVMRKVQLMDEPTTLNPADTEEFTRGLAFAKAERMDRACEIWRQLNQRTQSSDNSLLYNVAVCAETAGNYEEALHLLQQVDSRLSRPDKNVSQALDRVKASLAAR